MINDDLVQRALLILTQRPEPEKAGKQQQGLTPEPPTPTVIHHDDLISWQRADLSIQYGMVDFTHPDADGTVWAYCTCPDGGWVAVNTKYLTPIEGDGP